MAKRLKLLTGRLAADLADVALQLLDHADQGIYRPGSWERPWLIQAFGVDFIALWESAGRPRP